MMPIHLRQALIVLGIFATAMCGIGTLSFQPAKAENAQVLVTVNDTPITSFDIRMRIALWKLLGERRSGDQKKRALDELIDSVAVIEAAKRRGMAPSAAEVDKRMEGIAKSLKTDYQGLKGKLKAQGVSLSAMRQYITAQFSFYRLLRAEGKSIKTEVSDAEVNRKLAEFRAEINGKIDSQIAKLESDPRRRPISVYQILEISFPVDAPGGEITQQVLQSRAIEVNQFISRFKGCGSARSAASGIFNVKIGKQKEADAAKIPKQLKNALDKAGTGRALGPVRDKTGLMALALCGVRKIVPPKIERPKDIKYPEAAQVRRMLEQEKTAELEDKYRGNWRDGLIIEFRDPALGQ